MMRRVDILPERGKSSGWKPESDHAALPIIEKLLPPRANSRFAARFDSQNQLRTARRLRQT
jgi:hypothetical protein